MSEPETILARWSRLKREQAKPAPDAVVDAAPTHQNRAESDAATDPPAFDVPDLPPIDSIVAGSDIRGFLQAGVPAALTRAALLRAWATDPAIRDFIEMAENQCDFTNPDSIPGFGSLTEADDVDGLVARALGQLKEEAPRTAEDYAAPASGTDVAPMSASNLEDQRRSEETAEATVAPQHHLPRPEPEPQAPRRNHGRALPR